MVRLRIGNNFDGNSPSKATISEFRAGQRELGEYTFKTLPLDQISPNFPKSKEITVNEIKRFFDRKTQPRMTTGATMFANLTDVDEGKWYSRVPDERMYGDFSDSIRSYGMSSLADESIGLKFRLYRSGENHNTVEAYFDNALLEVSNILWEFSSDGGDKWYQLYDLPNRAYTRITLPKKTTRLKVRALSNNLEDWVQSFAITPKSDFQKIGNESDRSIETLDSLTISKFGYLKWDKVKGATGSVVYDVYKKEETKDRLIVSVIDANYQLSEFDYGDKFYVVAVDEVGNRSVSNVVVYDYDDIFYKWVNYNIVAYRNAADIDDESNTFIDMVDGLAYVYGPAGTTIGETYLIEDEWFGGYSEDGESIVIDGQHDRFTFEGEAENGSVVVTKLSDSEYSDGSLGGFDSVSDGVANVGDSYSGEVIDRYRMEKEQE